MPFFFSAFRSALLVLALFSVLPPVCWAEKSAEPAGEKQSTYRLIEWPQLMHKDDLDALLNPPESLDEITDGSPEDQITSQIQQSIEQAVDDRYQQALVSTRIVEAFNGESIRLPGFVVPVAFGKNQEVTQFFLVPYFGACIHMPPPPPNQIIFATYPQGLKQENLYDPFWVSGVLKTTLIENEVATAAYAINVEKIEPYYP